MVYNVLDHSVRRGASSPEEISTGDVHWGFDDLVDYLTSFSNEGKIGMMVPKLQRRELVKS